MNDHPEIAFKIQSAFRQLDQDKLTPWAFLLSDMQPVVDFLGRTIRYSGVTFEGTPQHIFWNGFIEPFLEAQIAEGFQLALDHAQKRGVDVASCLLVARNELYGGITSIYRRMQDIDRRLRGSGTPQSVPLRDVKPSIHAMQEKVNEYYASAAKATVGATESRMKQDILLLLDRKLALLMEPKINEAGREFFTVIQSLKPDEYGKVTAVLAEYSSSVGKWINGLFAEAKEATMQVFSSTDTALTDDLIKEVIVIIKKNVRDEVFIKKFDAVLDSATRHFRGFGVNVLIPTQSIDLHRSSVVATTRNLPTRNLLDIENELRILALSKEKRTIHKVMSMGAMSEHEGEQNMAKTEKACASWADVESEYHVSKRQFGKKINFVKDDFKRKIIFRDIEQANFLASNGFYKSAVILAGGVTEELLRLYLESKGVKPQNNTLVCYIKACDQNGLLKSAIHKLADSFREFRNLVHLEREESAKHSISRPTAKSAVASVFTIVNDFEKDA